MPDVKISVVAHVQPAVFKDAFAKYGFTDFETALKPINIDAIKDKPATDFGYIGADLKNPWDGDYRVWKKIKDLGIDSFFTAHQHANSGSTVYEGVRLQFGQKSSTYDRANYITADNKIVCSFTCAGIPIVGGSVFCLSHKNGEILNPHIYLCKNAGGDKDLSTMF